MTSTVTRNVTIRGPLLTIAGNVAPTNGILVDNSAFTLTMNPPNDTDTRPDLDEQLNPYW
jgi:hypothetical protein